MGRGPWITLAALSLGAIVFIAASAPSLPPVVATHFAAGGRPNGWMSREGYTLFMLVFAVVLPWLVFAGVAFLPAGRPGLVNPGGGDRGAESALLERALALRRRFGAGLAVAMIVLGAATHFAILAAHRQAPPRLDEGPFLVVVGLFGVAIVVAALRFRRQFKRIGAR